MQHSPIASSPRAKPVEIEVDGEPLGVVIPEAEGFRFLAVRLSAFAIDGRRFDSIASAKAAASAARRADS